uniref:Uncharacterized protein n=1 Tax=viral metagenome TaxID=1070528 RepID=A0A6M3KUG4_9ZZZZ
MNINKAYQTYPEPRHVGVIQITPDLLLRLLEYSKDGTITDVWKDLETGNIKIRLEHPEMPLVRNGEYIMEVCPTYIVYENELGNRLVQRQR